MERKCKHTDIPVRNTHLFTLLFPNRHILIAQDEEDISYMVRKEIEEFRKWGSQN